MPMDRKAAAAKPREALVDVEATPVVGLFEEGLVYADIGLPDASSTGRGDRPQGHAGEVRSRVWVP